MTIINFGKVTLHIQKDRPQVPRAQVALEGSMARGLGQGERMFAGLSDVCRVWPDCLFFFFWKVLCI